MGKKDDDKAREKLREQVIKERFGDLKKLERERPPEE